MQSPKFKPQYYKKKKIRKGAGVVAHAYNPCYSGGRGRRIIY
jgi:hypothetical protein